MDLENLKSWASQPDVCRCCLSTSGAWDITASYITEAGNKEVYSDMLQECYGITLSCLTDWNQSRLVCNLCVGHLRDACSFRKQVLQAEEHFTTYCITRSDTNLVSIKTETDLAEREPSPGFFYNDPVYSDDDNINTAQNQIDSSNMKNNTEANRGNCGEKKPRSNLKTKRKKGISKDNGFDSDTPIAELSKKNIVGSSDVNMEKVKSSKLQEYDSKISLNLDRVDVLSKESQCPGPEKSTKLTSDNYIDNRNLRSNISLILKNSTVLPFKHIYNSKYICLYCDKAYLFFKELKEHISDTHFDISINDIIICLKTPKDLIKADVSDMRCKICEENFKTIDKLIGHLIEIHNKIYHRTKSIPSHGILGFDLSSEKNKCHICSKEFRFFKNLSIHMNDHSDNFMCHVCGKKFVSDHRLQAHVVTHKRRNIKCKHCSKDFRSMSARSYHIRKVHNEASFKCPECPQMFSQYQHRLNHLAETHKLKKPEFKCDVCTKHFASSGGLRAHMRYVHLKTKEYTCDICGKVFVYKWIWQRHMDVHAGIKKYECKFCNKKFAKPYTLEVHVRIHLNDKRFTCTVCKAAFIQKCSLKNHLRVHHSDESIDLSKI